MIYSIHYFCDGLQETAFVYAEAEDKAVEMVSKGKDIEVYRIKEIPLTHSQIIHIEVIEVI